MSIGRSFEYIYSYRKNALISIIITGLIGAIIYLFHIYRNFSVIVDDPTLKYALEGHKQIADFVTFLIFYGLTTSAIFFINVLSTWPIIKDPEIKNLIGYFFLPLALVVIIKLSLPLLIDRLSIFKNCNQCGIEHLIKIPSFPLIVYGVNGLVFVWINIIGFFYLVDSFLKGLSKFIAPILILLGLLFMGYGYKSGNIFVLRVGIILFLGVLLPIILSTFMKFIAKIVNYIVGLGLAFGLYYVINITLKTLIPSSYCKFQCGLVYLVILIPAFLFWLPFVQVFDSILDNITSFIGYDNG